MKSPSFPRTIIASLLLCTAGSGCAMIAASGDTSEDAAAKRSAQDNDERMRRMREDGTLRPGEYDALRDKMGAPPEAEIAPKPSVDELQQRVDATRKAQQQQPDNPQKNAERTEARITPPTP